MVLADHLERIAIKVAKGLADGSIKANPRKKTLQDKVMNLGPVRLVIYHPRIDTSLGDIKYLYLEN